MSAGRLAGHAAIVTGAGSGIGRAIALRFAAEGATVLAAGRTEAKVAETAAAIRAGGGRAEVATLDVADAGAVAELYEWLPALLGPDLHVLVNGAGVQGAETAPDTSPELWDDVFATNARGTFLMSRHAIEPLRRTRGAIVNVASVAGIVGVPKRAAYCASKAAVLGLTRAMAVDHVGEGVRVNALCPGTTATPWIERMVSEHGESRADLEARQPMGRLGTADEMAEAALYLAAPGSAFVTGTQLVVDGGATAA